MYMLDANAALKERTLSGEESELMTGVSDFTLDAVNKTLLCVTQDGVTADVYKRQLPCCFFGLPLALFAPYTSPLAMTATLISGY